MDFERCSRKVDRIAPQFIQIDRASHRRVILRPTSESHPTTLPPQVQGSSFVGSAHAETSWARILPSRIFTVLSSPLPTSSIPSITLARSSSFGKSRRAARPRNCLLLGPGVDIIVVEAAPAHWPLQRTKLAPASEPCNRPPQSSRCTRSIRSWRSCASIDRVAIGRASRRRNPIGSLVSSQ